MRSLRRSSNVAPRGGCIVNRLGRPLQAAGRIETHVGRDPGDQTQTSSASPGKTTRYAATNYTVLATLDNNNLSVLGLRWGPHPSSEVAVRAAAAFWLLPTQMLN